MLNAALAGHIAVLANDEVCLLNAARAVSQEHFCLSRNCIYSLNKDDIHL